MQNENTNVTAANAEGDAKADVIKSAEIVAVGTEMLLGELVDTNTAWMSSRLAALGVSIYRHTTVGDNKQRVVAALQEAASRADLVLTTGGLGPTSDDVTNECLGLVAGREMVEYPEARQHVDEMFNLFELQAGPFPRRVEAHPQSLGHGDGCASGARRHALRHVPRCAHRDEEDV